MAENRQRTGFRGPSPQVGRATQWQPGCPSPNPGGRPKKTPLSDACREVLASPVPGDPEGRTYAEKIAATLAEKAANGDIRAAQELADRAEGKARQSVEIENATLRAAFERMSKTELETYAATGGLPQWFPHIEGESEALH